VRIREKETGVFQDDRKRFLAQRASSFALACCLLVVGCDSNDDASKANSSDSPTAGKGGSGGSSASAGGGAKAGDGDKTDGVESGKGEAGSGNQDGDKAGSRSQSGDGDDAGVPDKTDDGKPDDSDAKPTDKKSLYALAVEIYNPDDTSSTYLTTFNTLDITGVELKKARELPGRADIIPFDGKLFITSEEAPTLTRYDVADDGTLSGEKTISFAKYGVEATVRPDLVFVSPTKAYLAVDEGYAIWNPTTMELGGELKLPDLPLEKNGLDLNGSAGVLRGDKVYRVYFWVDWSTYEFSKEQYVAVIDTKTDKLVNITAEDRCPALGAQPQLDEAGNIYLSNWFYNVPGTLMNGAPHSCALRLSPGSDVPDADWKLEFDAVAQGHEGSQLSATTKGQALFSVFRQDHFTFTKDTDAYMVTASENWETWTVDLKNPSSAKPVAGVSHSLATQTNVTLDGRTFVFLPGTDWSKTKVEEILPAAKSRDAFSFDGSTFLGFVKIK
jgi:hypothetical protein